MNRRDFLKCFGVGSVVMATLGLFSSTTAMASGGSAGKPNFVVILLDDMGYGDIGPFGSKLNRTPRLDRMAAEGMRLTSFYAASICTPSRAQLMTGCYAKRVGLSAVLYPKWSTGLSTKEKTVATLLKERGYATMCIGKWHLGDQEEFLPTRHGFDHYLGLPYSNDMGQGPKHGKNALSRPPLPLLRDETVIEAPVVQDKLTKLYTDEAVKFITANKEKPFFLYLPHTAVHIPIQPGVDFKGKSANGTFGDWVEEVDWSTGRILDTLRELQLDNNTLVIFTSDNGPFLGAGKFGGSPGPFRGGKFTTWEGGLRVPTIAWWPKNIAPGSVCDAPASEMDVLPTLVKLAGGSVPTDRVIDGKDIWPLLSGASKDSPHEALFYFRGMNGNYLEAVRAGAWKLAIAEQHDGQKSKIPKMIPASLAEPRLYNLDTDPGEQNDVAAQHPEVVQQLKGFIGKMDADLGISLGRGPGARPCGKVANPKPLLMRDAKEYD
jgi:arylsulfatase A-like enzyme